jgi:hypothetical protein
MLHRHTRHTCTGASLFCNPAGTPPAAAAIPGAPEGNSAILGQLKRRQQTQQRYGTTSDPAVALSDRFTVSQVNSQQHVDGVLLYLSRHGQHASSFSRHRLQGGVAPL